MTNFESTNVNSLPSIGSPDRRITAKQLNFSNDVYILAIEDQLDFFIPQIFKSV